MRYVAIVLLWLAASLGHAAQVSFAWDAQPEYPPGVTYELIANECSLSGITATTATCALAGAPGSPLHAQVRAISPDAEQWSDSAWTSIDDVIPGAVALYTTPGDQTQLNVIRSGGGGVMAAPTYQTTTQSNSPADFASANTSTTRTTPSYSPSAGTILVGCGVSEDMIDKPITAISGGPTWTQQYLDNTASKTSVALYTATADGGAITSTVTSSASDNKKMGLAVLQFTGSDGIGAKNTAKGTTGFPSVSLTTTQANSAVVMVVGDWSAVTGTSTFSTVNSTPVEIVDYADAARYGVHIAYWPDVGAAGAKTFAMSAPSGQNWTAHVIEIKGTAGAAGLTISSAGSAVVTGYAPTRGTARTVAAAGSAVVTGQQPARPTLRTVSASGTAVVTGQQPARPTLRTVSASGTAVVTGYAPSLGAARTVSAAGGAVVTGYAPAMPTLRTVPAGSAVVTGYSPSIPTLRTVASAGTAVVSGYAPSRSQGNARVISAAGAAVVSGYAPARSVAFSLQSVGSAVATGYPPTLGLTRTLASAGSAVVTGYAPSRTISLTIAGMSATASPGILQVIGHAVISVSGQGATSSLNGPAVAIAPQVLPTGLVGTTALSSVGVLTAAGEVSVMLQGLSTATSTPTAVGKADLTVDLPTGFYIVTEINSVSFGFGSEVHITGIGATSNIGVIGSASDAIFSVAGLSLVSSIGPVQVREDIDVFPVGLELELGLGKVKPRTRNPRATWVNVLVNSSRFIFRPGRMR